MAHLSDLPAKLSMDGPMIATPCSDMDQVWLSTVGFAHGDGMTLLDPPDRAETVKDFLLGVDQLMITQVLEDRLQTLQSLAPWIEFRQIGAHGLLRLDAVGQGDFNRVLTLTLEDFYQHNPHFMDLTADDLRQLGGFDV